MSALLLSNAEAAARMGIPPQSLRLKRMKGVGPPYVRLGGPTSKAYYRTEDLEKFLAALPSFTSTMAEKAAAYAKAKAAAPKPTRKRHRRDEVAPGSPSARQRKPAGREAGSDIHSSGRSARGSDRATAPRRTRKK